jgi:hypothetical protein
MNNVNVNPRAEDCFAAVFAQARKSRARRDSGQSPAGIAQLRSRKLIKAVIPSANVT